MYPNNNKYRRRIRIDKKNYFLKNMDGLHFSSNFCIILKKLISYRAVVYNSGPIEQQINNCTLYMAKNPSILYTDCMA